MTKDIKALLMAIIASTCVLLAWQYFYENPRKAKIEQTQIAVQQAKLQAEEKQMEKAKLTVNDNPNNIDNIAGQVSINTKKLKGNISLKGLRFDDLQLESYHQTIDKNSPLVKLFTPTGLQAYFAEFGWIKDSSDQTLNVPDKNSIWQCDQAELTENKSINCEWRNSESISYHINIAIDDNYLFTINQSVQNRSAQKISLSYYARIYKANSEPKQFAILHEGAIGVFGDILKEVTYEDLSKSRQEFFTNTPGSWAGITDKYWLTALIPDSNLTSKTNFIASSSNEVAPHDTYNVNYISQEVTIESGSNASSTNYLFAGAKEEKLLEHYAKEKSFALFDRSIDFGIFYFITKPLFWLISYFYSLIGNFGLAIILVTLTIKLLMYPLARKSFVSMNKMKEIQPKVEQIKQKCGEDKMKFNQEIMALYKKENVSPAAGCLPLLIQIPVFFSLYKVIFISIEMRHAPFFGWIKDLSAPDPTSIWNAFGLLPFGTLGMLDVGIWPLIMGITMYLQQKMSPAPADPVQASVMKFMPLILVIMLYSLPSGLMIYWSFSNILTIAQQKLISKTAAK